MAKATRSLSPKQIAERERDHRFAVISLARYRAKKAIEAQIRAQGKRPIAYTPAQLRALAQAEFELNRIALIAAAQKTVNTSPLFKRWRLPGANLSSDAQSKEPCSVSTISVQNLSANRRDDQ